LRNQVPSGGRRAYNEVGMGDIVNLNRFRKDRDRRAAEKRAADNRARFGLPKPEREKAKAEAEKLKKDLENKRLE
jgi:hypothetical protein